MRDSLKQAIMRANCWRLSSTAKPLQVAVLSCHVTLLLKYAIYKLYSPGAAASA
jgi:hypothetical protein